MLTKSRVGLFVVLSIIFLSFATACSRTFVVKPVGSFDQAVEFHFSEPQDFKRLSARTIVELIVQEQINEKEWMVVWWIAGSQSLDVVVYGQKYENLKEVKSIRPLVSKGRYRVIVKDQPILGPVGYAEAVFEFGNAGEVIVKE